MSWEGNRAADYDKLEWANDDGLIGATVGPCEIMQGDSVLDFGTGTGIIAKAIARAGVYVVAYDTSAEMLEIARKRLEGTDAFCTTTEPFDEEFNVVVMRNVLHHLDNAIATLFGFKENMAKGARLIVCEGVPPPACSVWYEGMFRHKEKRKSYSLCSIVEMMEQCGYAVDYARIYVLKQVSLTRWLEHSGCKDKNAVWDDHANAPPYVKSAYDMREFSGDIFMNWNFAIARGRLK